VLAPPEPPPRRTPLRRSKLHRLWNLLLGCAVTSALLPATARAAPLIGEWGGAFPQGTKTVEVGAAYITPIRFSDDHFYGGVVAAHYYFGDEVSIGAQFDGYWVDQEEDDTALAGASLILRWHFLASERYTLFIDAVGGVSYAAADVPEGGTQFNYIPRIGGGATVKLRDDLHLLGGVRFFHLSNGNLNGRDENPSQDGAQFFVGLMWTF
jgi:hypothetical protein